MKRISGPKPRQKALCIVCRERRVKYHKNKTCSHTCGALSRTDLDVMRALAAKARAAFRQRYVERMRVRLREDIVQLTALGVPADVALSVAARIHQRAYHSGWVARGVRDRHGRAA